ncbi:MAG: Crp/Fnr family transcriptional regulator [Angelakisella sp.]|nr:Crp/Fnr family transcriptional regulator [Angelakisella sp.]
MTQYLPLLRQTALFEEIADNDILTMLCCFGAVVKNFLSGEIILLAGYDNHQVGIVLEGRLIATKATPKGNEVAMSSHKAGSIFGDVLSGSHVKSPVTVRAATDCRVLFLPYDQLISPCACGHQCHSRLLRNLVGTISDKYFALNKRVDLLILRSLRQRIAQYLLDSSGGSTDFTVPYDREGLAAYLNCDRTALCRELSRMKKEGLIDYRKNYFSIVNPQAVTALLLE